MVCRAIADSVGLARTADLVVGPDQMFWDFRRGDQVVGLDWDVWLGFSIVARSAEAEPLVLEIAGWLDSGGWSGELNHGESDA